MKTYVINLDRRPDRLREMARRLDSLGVGFERIPAVDGQKINHKPYVNRIMATLYRDPTSRMTGAIGCYLSHRSVWQSMVEEGIPQALILEDDADPVAWNERIMHVQLSDLKLDVLRLGANKLRNIVTRKRIGHSDRLLLGRRLVFEPTAGTCAYLITLEGARKCLAADKYWFPIDHFHLWKNLYGVNSALLTPLMFVPSHSKSDILDGNRQRLLTGPAGRVSASLKRKFRRLVWKTAACYATCWHRPHR